MTRTLSGLYRFLLHSHESLAAQKAPTPHTVGALIFCEQVLQQIEGLDEADVEELHRLVAENRAKSENCAENLTEPHNALSEQDFPPEP